MERLKASAAAWTEVQQLARQQLLAGGLQPQDTALLRILNLGMRIASLSTSVR